MDSTHAEIGMTDVMDVDVVTHSSTPNSSCPVSASRIRNALSKLADSDSDANKDDAPIRKPGGRLLSRLQPQSEKDSSDSEEEDDDQAVYERAKQRLMSTKPINISSSEDEDENDAEDAYERMRKQLMAPRSQQEPQLEQVKGRDSVAKDTSMASSDDEDDVPVRANRSRVLQTRREKTTSLATSPSASVRSRNSSPGLFVTPNASPVLRKHTKTTLSSAEEPEQSPTHTPNADFNEKVKRIRAERLAREKKRQEQQKHTKTTRQEADDKSDSNSDSEDGRRLTQQAKPTRKAGKKALEAMARDQQRIVRNMQLAHQARTKKRYGMKDLFAKLGVNQTNAGLVTANLPTPDHSSLPPSPDAEVDGSHDTPPTSPPSFEDAPKTQDVGTEAPAVKAPQTESLSPSAKLDKGKGRALEFQHVPLNPLVEQSKAVIMQNARRELAIPITAAMVELSDSDSDVEIAQPKSRFPVFDKLPEKKKQEAPSLLHLRHLAQLTSPSKRGPKGRKTMNLAELQFSLHQKARKQAQREREEKIEELRSKGIHVETEEEREKRQMEVEDIVAQFEKARDEDLRLAKLERGEAKRNGEIGDGLASSDESEDDDYVGSGDENAAEGEEMDEDEEEIEFELSGSEDEEAEDEEEPDESNELLDEMAEDEVDGKQPGKASGNGSTNGDRSINDDMDDDEQPEMPVRKHAARRVRNLVVDDEDEDEDVAPQDGSPTQVMSQNDAMAAFGFGNAGPALGLTQAFAGTMANLDASSQNDDILPQEPEQDSLDFLRSLPDTQPDANFNQAGFFIPNSQAAPTQQDYSQDGPTSQINLGISQVINTSPAFSRTQLSEVPEPTQDAGFLMSRSPTGLNPPISTVDTVMMQITESPIVQRKGKLRRGREQAPIELSDADEDPAASDSEFEVEDAFRIMKQAAKKQPKAVDFNKETSYAKDIVEEQAYESDDEWNGMGGEDGDEVGDHLDEATVNMIDDTTDVKVDERELAAYVAQQAMIEDQKASHKLLKDLNSGYFRKRVAGRDDWEMSDSEDEAKRQQIRKQRKFQQSLMALKKDERIGKIAENVKQAAFFKTLIDHSDDEDFDFVKDFDEDVAEASQSQSEENKEENEDFSVPDSQTLDVTTTSPVNPLKRKSPDSQEKENRPPPNLRRTAGSGALTKPTSLADIQNRVSELLEDPRVMVPNSQYSSESEDEFENPLVFPSKRKQPLVDRLTLSRTSSSSDSTTTAKSSGSMAFHAPSAGSNHPGFRVPSLIRRATSNFSTTSERSSGSNTPVEGGVRRGGTGKSNIHAQAREAERRAVVEKADMKRKEALKRKVGRARGARSVLKDLGDGFE